MTHSLVLSHFQARPLLQARDAGAHRVRVSPDLGLTTVEVAIQPAGARFPDGQTLRWEAVEAICDVENGCFVVEDGEPRKIQVFSEESQRLYSLMPTPAAPTMLVSGVPMHRIKDTDPHRDTLEKVRAIKPVVGRVLDTATGLGYTAIEAARTADQVVTVEVEPAVLDVARLNPWSRDLFGNTRIEQRIGDSYDVVAGFDEGAFARVIHDPPAFRLAGHLYSGAFYTELYRVLRRGGWLFHYVGDPESKSGRSVTDGVARRLQEAGFSRVRRHPQAFGVVALR